MKRVLLALLLVPGTAMAHSWYSAACCSGTDCSPIPPQAVKVVEGGYQVTLNAGDHPLVTRPHVFFIEQPMVKQSQDDLPHACMYPNEDTLHCLYMPPVAF